MYQLLGNTAKFLSISVGTAFVSRGAIELRRRYFRNKEKCHNSKQRRLGEQGLDPFTEKPFGLFQDTNTWKNIGYSFLTSAIPSVLASTFFFGTSFSTLPMIAGHLNLGLGFNPLTVASALTTIFTLKRSLYFDKKSASEDKKMPSLNGIQQLSQLMDNKTDFQSLKKLFPKGTSDRHIIETLRKVSAINARDKLNKLSKRTNPLDYMNIFGKNLIGQRMGNTIQVENTTWKGKNIKVVGWRHGSLSEITSRRNYLKYHQASTKALYEALGKNNNKGEIIAAEENLRPIIDKCCDYEDLPKLAIENVKDHKMFGKGLDDDLYLKSRHPQQLVQHMKTFYDKWPDYDLYTQACGRMPEYLEIQAHQEVGHNMKNIGYSDENTLLDGRSAYMAGWCAGASEQTGKDVTIVQGGGHLWRTISCLKLAEKKQLPKSLERDFNEGVIAGKKAYITKTTQHTHDEEMIRKQNETDSPYCVAVA